MLLTPREITEWKRQRAPIERIKVKFILRNFCLTLKNAVDVRNMVRGRDDKINQLKFGAAKQQNTFLKRFQVFCFSSPLTSYSILFGICFLLLSSSSRLSRSLFSFSWFSFISCTASLTSSSDHKECRYMFN